jgi:hypothetical protein
MEIVKEKRQLVVSRVGWMDWWCRWWRLVLIINVEWEASLGSG